MPQDKFQYRHHRVNRERESVRLDQIHHQRSIKMRLGLKGDCRLCKGDHALRKCHRFKNMSVKEKLAVVKRLQYCKNCLAFTHVIRRCKSSASCHVCKKRHHTLLHINSTRRRRQSPTRPNSQEPQRRQPITLLPTVLVRLHQREKTSTLRAIINACEPSSIIAESVVNLLNLRVYHIDALRMCEFCVRPYPDIDFVLRVRAKLSGNLTFITPQTNIDSAIENHYKNLTLADPYFFKASKINLILGADVYQKINKSGVIHGNDGIPMAQNTSFGWVIVGSYGL